MKILITGIYGFAAGYLAEHLFERHPSAEIFGIGRKSERSEFSHPVFSTPRARAMRLAVLDLTDQEKVFSCFREISPDSIFHLAAQSTVVGSWNDPRSALQNNILSSVNVLEAVRRIQKGDYNPRVLLVGSSEQYGYVSPDELPLHETCEMRPSSPYAVSKLTQDFLGLQYSLSYKLCVLRVRPFNHSGAGRDRAFVDSGFAYQIARIEESLQEPEISVGNLEAIRDFSDVRDIVRAYADIVEKGVPGEVYNACSGEKIAIKDILQNLLSLSTKRGIRVIQDPSRMRPSDNPILYGSHEKITQATGWKPKYSFLHDTIPEVVNFWRKEISRKKI